MNAISSIIRRRPPRPRREIDLNKFSQILRGSADDDLIADTSYFVFNSLFYGEPVQFLEKRFRVFCSTRVKDDFDCRVLYLLEWFDDYLWIACSRELQKSNLDRIHELTSVLVASLVRYWQMELMRLISMYAVLHILMTCCFIERSLSKMKPRLLTIPANPQSVFFREIACGCCKVMLTEGDDEKRIATVLSLFGLSLFSSTNSPISSTQS